MAFVLSNDARKFFQRIGISSAQGDRKSTTGYFDTMFDAFGCVLKLVCFTTDTHLHLQELLKSSPILQDNQFNLSTRFAA